jgi:predicted transcriptional regulator of viral defense system
VSTSDDRALAAKLAKASRGGLISLAEGAAALSVPRSGAALQFSRLARRGWLQRVRRGLYLVRPIDVAPDQHAMPEDPWVLAHEVFSPCYIGGWSAAEHWGLTEQLFRSTLVVTGATARLTNVTLAGHTFRIFRLPRGRLSAGVSQVWRGTARVHVSGLERTLIDGLRNPELLGGIRHVAQIMEAYGAHKEHNFARLLTVANSAASGAAWKRLGFLSERIWPDEPHVTDAARRHLTAGNAWLDPAVKHKGKLATRWHLWMNAHPTESS